MLKLQEVKQVSCEHRLVSDESIRTTGLVALVKIPFDSLNCCIALVLLTTSSTREFVCLLGAEQKPIGEP